MRSRFIRLAIVAAVAALGIGGAALPAQAEESLVPIRVGFHPNMGSGSSVYVGVDQKIFEKQGLDITPQRFTSAGPEISAIGAGQLDFAYAGIGGSINAMKGLANVVTLEMISKGDYVMARAGSGINKPADLKGKKVLVPEGTSADIVLRQALASVGLKYTDIEALATTPDGAVTAFAAGQADAIATWSPYSEEISAQMDTVIVASDNPDDKNFVSKGIAQIGIWLVSPTFQKENPEAVAAFIRAIGEANDYRIAHIDEIVPGVAKFTDTPEDALRAQIDATEYLSTADIQKDMADGTMSGWLKGVNQVFMDMGKMDALVPVEKYFDADASAAALSSDSSDAPAKPKAPAAQGGIDLGLILWIVLGIVVLVVIILLVRRRTR